MIAARIGRLSLRGRLLAAAAAVVLAAMVVAALSIGFVLHRFVRGQIDGRLDDRVSSLVADLSREGARLADMDRDVDAAAFKRPRSGWYWDVSGAVAARSASLAGRSLSGPDTRPDRRDPTRIRPADLVGPWGEPLIARIATLPARDGAATVVIATAPLSAVWGPVWEAFRWLGACLAAVGVLLLGGAFIQVRLGLKPLARLRDEIVDVRLGRATRLPTEQPTEVAPLVEEVNSLLAQNAAGLDGARAQVANLAHGLKTPLATLTLALSARGLDRDGSLARLTEAMDRRIRHHLARARAAAPGGTARLRAPLRSHLDDLSAAILRVHADKPVDIEVRVSAEAMVAVDPQDLDEVLGNLVDNACRFAVSKVRVAAGSQGAVTIAISIDDDGPGLAPAEAEAVLQRGRRLDESTPGHGFGLPIAAEIAGLYGGRLRLGQSDLGGLRVTVELPM